MVPSQPRRGVRRSPQPLRAPAAKSKSKSKSKTGRSVQQTHGNTPEMAAIYARPEALPGDARITLDCRQVLEAFGLRFDRSMAPGPKAAAPPTEETLQVMVRTDNNNVMSARQAIAGLTRRQLKQTIYSVCDLLRQQHPANLRGEARTNFDSDCANLCILANQLDPARFPLRVMQEPTVKGQCAQCGKRPSEEAALLRCGACRQAQYCNRECQGKAWRVHKLFCVKVEPTDNKRMLVVHDVPAP